MCVATALIFSMLALGLAGFAASQYVRVKVELKTARENRGMCF